MTQDKTISSVGAQDRATPWAFMEFVNRMFPICFDLAAHDKNYKHAGFFTEEDNSLEQDWSRLYRGMEFNSKGHANYLWLNPPFKTVTPWMEKCAGESYCKIVTLTLASRGTNWYHEFVKPFALSLILKNRLTFIGETQPFTKELMLNIYGTGITGEGYLDVPAKFRSDTYGT